VSKQPTRAIGKPSAEWPLLTANVSTVPKKVRGVLALARVQSWVLHGAGEDGTADRRACSLLVSVNRCWGNAHIERRTPEGHRKHYGEVVAHLMAAQQALTSDLVPAAQQACADLKRHISALQAVGESPRVWTDPRPQHAAAARNDFIRSLSQWLSEFCEKTRSPLPRGRNELVAEITNYLFEDDVAATQIQSLLRK
jgi:hypothetical protein